MDRIMKLDHFREAKTTLSIFVLVSCNGNNTMLQIKWPKKQKCSSGGRKFKVKVSASSTFYRGFRENPIFASFSSGGCQHFSPNDYPTPISHIAPFSVSSPVWNLPLPKTLVIKVRVHLNNLLISRSSTVSAKTFFQVRWHLAGSDDSWMNLATWHHSLLTNKRRHHDLLENRWSAAITGTMDSG